MIKIIVLAALATTTTPEIKNQSNRLDHNTLAVTCFKSGENVSGMNKMIFPQ